MTLGTSSRADANRRRILDVALAELLRDPDVSMHRIARAAGVVRRTVYGHFPSRDALIGALADEAAQVLSAAQPAVRSRVGDPAEALARSVLAVWEIADRYRLLVALAQRTVTVHGVRERLAPVREHSVRLLRHGLDDGTFISPLPAAALACVQEQILFGLMEAVEDKLLAGRDAGRSAAVTVLASVGVPATLAAALVAKVSAPAVPPAREGDLPYAEEEPAPPSPAQDPAPPYAAPVAVAAAGPGGRGTGSTRPPGVLRGGPPGR